MLKFQSSSVASFKDFVERVWLIKNDVESKTFIIPPSPYINIIIPLYGQYFVDGVRQDGWRVEGVAQRTSVVTYSNDCLLLGIRFYCYGYYLFRNGLPIPGLNEVKSIPVNPSCTFNITDYFSTLIHLLEEVYEPQPVKEVELVKNYYKFLKKSLAGDALKQFCLSTNISYSTLNRSVRKVCKLNGKQLDHLLKFRKSLCQIIDRGTSLTRIGIDSGYYDQAHFTKTFKTFLQVSPSELKKSLPYFPDGDLFQYNFRSL